MSKRDLLKVVKAAALAMIAWSTPPRLWRKVAAITSSFGTVSSLDLRVYQRILGPTLDATALSNLNRKRRICNREAALQVMALRGTWRSWRPDIRLHGETHLRKALDDGRGAILWITESAYSALIFKMALNSAGYRASQLSRPDHGFGSSSSFGVKFLNPLWTRVEDRFIDERVTIRDGNAAPALAILRTRLAANRVVIITITTLAHKLVEVPFFKHSIRLPTGPMRLMRETGAALLPAFVFADEFGCFDVTIEGPLPSCDKQEAFDTIATAYAKLLEPYVSAYPEQWTGWGFMLSKTQMSQNSRKSLTSSHDYPNP